MTSRSPTFTRIPERDRSVAVQAQRFAVALTLTGGGAMPFRLQDQPNPIRAVVQRQDFMLRGVRSGGLAAAPFRQSDWPNPQAPRRLGELTITEVALVGQDVILIANQNDQPNPIWPVQRRQDFFSQPIGQSVSAPPMPFSQGDWPNPRAAQPRNLDPGSDGLSILPFGMPFSATDWPTPRLTVRLLHDVGDQSLVGLPSGGQPFQQSDWPIWRAPPRAHDVGQGANLALVAGVPFSQTEHPNPIRPGPRQAYEQRQTLSLGSDVLAFRQSEWPVPPAPRRLPQDWTQAGLTYLIPLPFNTYEWPVPRGPALRDREFVAYSLAARFPQPFSQSDQPLPPRGWPPRDVDRGQSQPLPLQIGAPFFQNDQPNPIRPRFWTADVGPNPYAYRVMPFAQVEWPVPRAAPHPIEARLSRANPMPQGGVQPFNYTDWWPGRPAQRETVAFTYSFQLSIQGPGAQLSSVGAASAPVWTCTANSVWSGGAGTWPGMSTPTYPLDTQIELTGTFQNAAGALVDPSTVTCRVVDGRGNLTVYSGGQITRQSVGLYTLVLTPSVSGPWFFDWQGAGAAIVTSGDQRFNIARSVAIRG